MDGFELVLGNYWLDMINPLVDWRGNTACIRYGDELHTVIGIPTVQFKPCRIMDRGLAGLQDDFSRLHNEVKSPLHIGKWGELYQQLASPTFWEYQTNKQTWALGPMRTLELPPGEVKPLVPTNFLQDSANVSHSFAQPTTILNSSGSRLSKTQDKKIEFISLKETLRMATNDKILVYLAVICPADFEDVTQKRMKSKTKIKTWEGIAHGLTEGKKCRMWKESGPVKDTRKVEDIKKEMVKKADPKVKGELSNILEEYGDIFPEKLPYGPPPRRVIDHEIEVVPGSTSPHKSSDRLSNVEMEELRTQVDILLEPGLDPT